MENITIEQIKANETEIFCGIENYEERVEEALCKIDHWRCPLRMADNYLYWQMFNALDEYCQNNDLCPDDICIDDIIF